MSAGLVKKILRCGEDVEPDAETATAREAEHSAHRELIQQPDATRADDSSIGEPAEQQAQPPSNEMRVHDIEVPMIVRKFARVLKRENLVRRTKISCVMLRAELRVLESDVRRGVVGYSQKMGLFVDATDTGGCDPKRWWQAINDTLFSMPYALSALLVGYDASEMPFDTQISLRGFSTETERELGTRTPTDAELRDHILYADRVVPRGSKPFSLLTRPLVCEEPITGVTFASIEAVGFSSQDFWSNRVARRVPESKAASVARLFARPPPDSAAAAAVHGSDSGGRGFYYVPLEYHYTSLLVRVHVYLTLQALRRDSVYEIDAESIDPATYELPTNSKFVIFESGSLMAAIRYIDERLVNVHPVFQPGRLRAMLEPHQYNNWTDAWNSRQNTGRTLNAVSQAHGEAQRRVEYAGESKTLSCHATFLIFYATFRRESIAGGNVLDAVSVSQSLAATAGHNGAVTDVDDDDDEDDEYQASSASLNAPPITRQRAASVVARGHIGTLGDASSTGDDDDDDDGNQSRVELEEATSGSYARAPTAGDTFTQQTAESGGSNDYGSWSKMAPGIDTYPTPTAVGVPMKRTMSAATDSSDDDDVGTMPFAGVTYAPLESVPAKRDADSGSATIVDTAPAAAPLRPTRTPPALPLHENRYTTIGSEEMNMATMDVNHVH